MCVSLFVCAQMSLPHGTTGWSVTCNFDISCSYSLLLHVNTVKHDLSGHSNKDKTKALMANGSLMKVQRIAECSPLSILPYF